MLKTFWQSFRFPSTLQGRPHTWSRPQPGFSSEQWCDMSIPAASIAQPTISATTRRSSKNPFKYYISSVASTTLPLSAHTNLVLCQHHTTQNPSILARTSSNISTRRAFCLLLLPIPPAATAAIHVRISLFSFRSRALLDCIIAC
jgi:hypothetical protein